MKAYNVTADFVSAATAALFNHPLGPTGGRGIPGYQTHEAAITFMRDLRDGITYNQGLRYGVASWGHVKWRYRLCEEGGPHHRPFTWDSYLEFYFVLYANAPRGKENDNARDACHILAAHLTDLGFPTLAED